jgi:hypothetical protein
MSHLITSLILLPSDTGWCYLGILDGILDVEFASNEAQRNG